MNISLLPIVFLFVKNLFVFKIVSAIEVQHFSSDDLRRIFQVNKHSQVPEYAIVHIGSRTRRSTDGGHTRTVHLRAFGEDKILTLTPNLHLARNVPVFYADPIEHAHDRISFTRLSQTEEDFDALPYQDEFSRAAVLVSRDPINGHLTLDGTIGDNLVVKPLPPSLHKHLSSTSTNHGRRVEEREKEESLNALSENDDDEMFLDEEENLEDDIIFSEGLPLADDAEFVTGSSILPSMNYSNSNDNRTNGGLPNGLLLLRKRRSTYQSGYHVVYKRSAPVLESDYELMEMVERSQDGKSRKKRDAPYVIYPEILVLVDYDGYLLHGQDNSAIKSYYVSFWNGVDLRYKLLKSPKVKVSIAGIIISRSRDAMPYLERNRVGRDAIDSASALTDMGKYLYQERRLPTYDIAVAITKLDMCRRTHKRGKCNRGTAGFAYVGGACVVNKRLMKVNSVAIVEDTGGFSGIIVAAHEVGHLLGAVHDGSPPPSYLGGPGARHCRWKDGYIMSDLRHTERGFRWSPCSTEQFHHFLNGETATCLYNLPHEDESLPRVLPGKLLSLDAQCKKDRGTTACFKDERVCAQLFCFDSSSGFCVSYRPAAEGSECGNGKICLNGKCVYDNENSISDYDIHSDRWNSWSDGNWDSDNFGDNPLLPRFSSSTTRRTTTTRKPKTTTNRKFHSNNKINNRQNNLINNNLNHNNRWTNSRNEIHHPTTKRFTSTRRSFVTWSTTPRRFFTTTNTPPTVSTTTTSTTSTRRVWTSRWSKNTITQNTTPRNNFWQTWRSTDKISTTPKITTRNKSFSTTTRKIKRTTHRFNNRWKNDITTHNSIISSNDSKGNCVDKLVKKPGKLTCVDFLTKYGNRYCNHRYIRKNCCKSRREFCS